MISDELYDITLEKKDRKLFYDRQKFIDGSVDWMDYKSDEDFDKDMIFHQNIRTISEIISQIVIFGRVIKERNEGEFNLPEGQVPLFMRQIDEKGDEEDLWDLSTGKIIKNWSKKKKGKKKLREITSLV